MTKRIFKSLPRLLEVQKIYYITLYERTVYDRHKYYTYPKEVTFNGEYIDITLKDYRIWLDPINNPTKFKLYPSYKVSHVSLYSI